MRLRVDVDGIQLVGPVKRRWWQFWRPPVSWQVVAEEQYPVHPHSRIALHHVGPNAWAVTVNDATVLTYPPGGVPS